MNPLWITCPECGPAAKYRHMHEEAHGVPGTHMAGSERFICRVCDYTLTRDEAKAQGLVYRFDVEDDNDKTA